MIYIRKKKPSQTIINKVNEIKRTEQWRCIQNGDTQAVRQEFDLLPKEEIRQSLLEEQRYLCAYCMKRIKNDGLHTTIEHWEPLSVNKDKALEYDNMLAVCDGGRKADLTGNVQRILCCDASKDEKEIAIDPTDERQMKLIKYKTNGEIYTDPEDKRLETDINQVLNLNGLRDQNGELIADTSTQLLKGRRDAYEQCRTFFRMLDQKNKFTSNMKKKRIDAIEKQDEMAEYAGVTLFFLKKKYRELRNRGL